MTGRNPSFGVLELDAEFLVPLNIKSYYFNLETANNGDPKWELLHDVIQEYGVVDTSPDGLFALAQKVLTDEATAKRYHWNSGRRAYA